MEAALIVDGVSKLFGSGSSVQYALRDVSLEVMPGEILMLRGPSGSGKTTLLSIMGGILTPSSGEVIVKGHGMSGLSRAALAALRLRYLGFIFQEYNLFPTLTCRGNVLLALDLLGVPRAEARDAADSIIETVGLADKLHEYPSRLSGGQKQRLAIARALAGSPAVVLADEPTAALDSQNGNLIMGLLRDLASRRATSVVIVTHDYRIREVADRVIFIEDGRLVPGPA